jgi:hypothetical protein
MEAGKWKTELGKWKIEDRLLLPLCIGPLPFDFFSASALS